MSLTDATIQIAGLSNDIATVKPASTAPVATDTALVAVLSPNQPAVPTSNRTDVTPGTINVTTQDTGSTTTTGANGQTIITGSPTANSAAVFALSSWETAQIQVSGTWTGTLQVEVSVDGGTTWFIRRVHQVGLDVIGAAFTQNFLGEANVGGCTSVRVRATAAMTGTAVVRCVESIQTNTVYVGNAQRITDNAGNYAAIAKGGLSTTANPWTTIIHNNATLTSTGSVTITGLGYSEWYLIINLKNAPTGTTPTITFKIEELDPVDQTTVISLKETGVTHTTSGIESINVREIDGDTVKITWTVTGTTPSWTGVNVSFVGHVSGNAIEGLSDVGSVAQDAPVPIAIVDSNNLVQRIRGDTLGDIGIAANLITAYTPDPSGVVDIPQPIVSDPASNLSIRGNVLTDEGSFRDDFTGSSLLTALTGTVSVTNGSTAVTGVGTLFTQELNTQRYIRLSAHANSALARVEQIISDTQLTLASNYTGATGSGAAVRSEWTIQIPASASITVGSSLVNLIASTTNGAIVGLTKAADYLPFDVVATGSISQRIANQQAVFGFQDTPFTPSQQAVFVFDGTDNTKVRCRTSYASDSIQETLITVPGAITTATSAVYEIVQTADRTTFKINGTQVASHRTHLPQPYTDLSLVAYIENTGAAGSATTLSFDAIFFSNDDNLSLDAPVAVEGVAGGQPIPVQFGIAGGGTALPRLIDVAYNKNDSAIVANVFKRVATYTVPAGYNGYFIKFISFQGEAAASRAVAENNFGSHNDSTNVFTAGTNYVSPQWASIVQAEVTTQFASGSGNVVLTVGYTNETGTAGRSGTITIPKGSVVGSRWDLVLQGSDLGVQSIQSVSGTPTQVGVAKILGLLQLATHQDQSTTTQTETLYAPGAITVPTGTVLGIEYAGGTVSKSRVFDMLIQLTQ